MLLKEFIKKDKNKPISLLWFENGFELKCENYEKRNNIKERFLNMEIMEVVQEEDVLEVWIR